ncbi:MAG: hypothetical protein JJ992_22015 [Planctomycetes bacterium]|nr:hypothetical protein [Planctomycetota bacterium]
MSRAGRPPGRRDTLVFAGFLIGLIVYLALYFHADAARAEAFLAAFVPDRVLAASIGGDWTRIGLADRLFVAVFAGWILLSAGACGWLSLSLAGCGVGRTRFETLLFSVAVGLNELSLLTLLLGLAGALQYPALFWLILVCVVAAAAHRWRRGSKSLSPPHTGFPIVDDRDDGSGFLARHGLWLMIPFVILILLGGMMPPWEFDVREYHLQVPKEWYQTGRIDFLPHNVYGNMPLGAEMHALLAMVLVAGVGDWWWGALIGKTVLSCFAPLGSLALYAAVRRNVASTAGVAAALLYISTPWVIYVSMTGLNEGVVACYAMLAAAAMVSWWRSVHVGEPSRRSESGAESSAAAGRVHGDLVLAGFFAGSAAACKYPALLFVVFPLAVWCWMATRRPQWKPLGVFLAAALVACGPWYAKNAVLAGNPVYPLVFGGATRTPQRMEQWNRAHRVPPDSRGRRYTLSQAADSIAQIGWRSRWLSPLLIPLASLAWVDRRHRRLAIALYWLTAWVLLVWWLTTHRIDRFLVPVLPWAAWLAGMGFVWSFWRPWRILAAAVLLAGLAFNFLYVISSGEYDRRLLVSLSELRQDEPSEPGGPSRVSPVDRFLNTFVTEGKRVLLVGDAQPFDLEVLALYSTCFDECLFERWMRGRSRQQRLEILKSHHIAYIYFDWSEIARYRSPGNYGFSEWITPELIHDEFVRRQGILRKVSLDMDPRVGELFEVVQTDAPHPRTDE